MIDRTAAIWQNILVAILVVVAFLIAGYLGLQVITREDVVQQHKGPR